MGQLPVNPLPDILKLIPEKETIVGPDFLDSIRILMYRSYNDVAKLSDSMILLVLSELNTAKLLKLKVLKIPDIDGDIITIKRK